MTTHPHDDRDQPMIPEDLVPRQRSDDPIATDDPIASGRAPEEPDHEDDDSDDEDDDSIDLDELP